jgi:hypothetical protein
MFLYTFFLTGLDNAGRDEDKAYTIHAISGDTIETVPVTVKEYDKKKENIRLEDTGSPKTVNLILYLIYRLTFRNVN